MEPDKTSKTEYWPAFKTTSVSFFWKLLIVLAGVGAYYGLNEMERTKSRYDQVKNASVVIVDTRSTTPRADTIEFTAVEVKDLISQPEVKKYVDRVKYQPLQNANALATRLNEEILKDQSSDERAIQQQSDLIAKEYAAKKYLLQTQRNEQCADAAKSEPAATEQKSAHVRRPRTTQRAAKICDGLAEALADTNYSKQREDIMRRLSLLTSRTDQRVRSVYEEMKPQLAKEIDVENKKNLSSTFAYVLPASVLDQKNGTHVIYNIFWLSCMVILVFGLLFTILLLLRPLPPFAGGTEALTEQAKSFLSKRGASATPELARTVIVTTAALGVGTAVAVAGGMNMGNPRETTFQPNLDGIHAYYQLVANNNDRRFPKPEAGPSPKVTIESYLLDVPPKVVHINSSDPRVDTLASNVQSFNTHLQSMGNGVTSLDNKVAQINNGFIGDLSRINQAVEQLETRHTTLSNQVITAETNVAELKGQADVLRGDVLLRLGITGEAMDGLRRDFATRIQPANRNFFSRVKDVFSFSDARYMVTNQSYMALESALCAVGYAPKDLNFTRSDILREDCDLTAPCARTSTCKNPTMQQVLSSLKGLVGDPPRTETELMTELLATADKDELKKWKPIVLRYTRISY